jgi:hypothetical protein
MIHIASLPLKRPDRIAIHDDAAEGKRSPSPGGISWVIAHDHPGERERVGCRRRFKRLPPTPAARFPAKPLEPASAYRRLPMVARNVYILEDNAEAPTTS